MKKNIAYLACLYATITLIFSGSCDKVEETRFELENGNADLRQCVIKKIAFGGSSEQGFPANSLIFTYNERKDPVIGMPDFIATGSPQWKFFYDAKGRLIHFAGLFTDTLNFQFWHTYFYDSQNRIIGDSLYNLGNITRLGNSAQFSYSALTYDRLNRISQETITGAHNPFNIPPFVYIYDAHGNLSGTAAQYDDKVNLLLTNKIWRFINRDYSINNQVTADAYNDHGLPTLYSNSTGGQDFSLFDFNNVPPVSVEYDCQ